MQALIAQVQSKAQATALRDDDAVNPALVLPLRRPPRPPADAACWPPPWSWCSLLDLLPPRERKDHLGVVSLRRGGAALIMTGDFSGGDELRGFRGMVVLDRYAHFFNVVIGYATGLVILLSLDYVRRAGARSRASSTSSSSSPPWA